MDFEEERKAWEKLGLNYYIDNVNMEFKEFPETPEPLFFTKINGATINQEKKGALFESDHLVDGKYYNGCICTLEEGDKLGDFFSCLPYGVINKKVTGIGATTLELTSDRNSIIVLPTKSLAYNKYKIKIEKDGEKSCMYIGSPIGNIKSDITYQDIRSYLEHNNGKKKKFLVVADSLPKLLKVVGVEHYNDYFLMIDEIDTLQVDNTYRPSLENVIDYYAKFKQENRAVVSATLKDFTHPELLKETIITTVYKTIPSRKIQLRHTNNEDYCTTETIRSILEKSPEEKVLIAYNSMDGILVCIKLLQNLLGERITSQLGILCGEMSKEKAGEFYMEIDEDGNLDKQVVFMTCAYFVGVDINNPCHVVSVSTFNQPFTLLSIEKFTQIAGRCRKGTLSETIIYKTELSASEYTLSEYKDKLLRKADLFTKAINKFKEVLDEAPELTEATNYIENIIKYIGIEKIAEHYPVSLLRQDIEDKLVPSYFNIDALLERWELHYSLYADKQALPDKLTEQGHIVERNPLYHKYTEQQKLTLGLVKKDKAEKLKQDLQEARQNLIEWDKINMPDLKADALRTYIIHAPKQIKKFYTIFSKFSGYYPAEYLTGLLIEHHLDDKRAYARFINSLALWTLDEGHPLKVLMLGEFNYHSIVGAKGRKAGINVMPQEKKDKMKIVCDSYFKGYPIDKNFAASLLKCFFKAAATKKHFRIKGLNPMEFQEPFAKITNIEPQFLLDLLILR